MLLRKSKKTVESVWGPNHSDRARACASPITRVLAYSEAKRIGAVNILEAEMDALGDKLRAVVVTDFERTSSMH